MRKRTQAREFALQLLYMADARDEADAVGFDEFVSWLRGTVEDEKQKALAKYPGKMPDEKFVRKALRAELELDTDVVLTVLQSAEASEFARVLYEGARRNLPDIDEVLTKAAQNWQINRMAIVDRNILRMAVYEMLNLDEIPAKVSINEAIELGKRYSTQQSGSFINGILDRIRREKKL